MVSELDYPHFFTLLERISHLEIHPFINQFINTLFCFKESRTVQFEDSWQNYLNSSVSVKEEYKSQTLNWFLLEFLQSLNNHQIQHYTIMSSLVYAMSNAFIDEKTKSHWKFEKQGFIDLLPSLDCTRKWNILDSLVCLLYAEFEKEIDCENDYNEKKTAKLIHLFACIVEGSDKFQWLNSVSFYMIQSLFILVHRII